MPNDTDIAPLVSVIIPVYNCEQFLPRCLDSVFAQTMDDFEVLAINDGSTDGSLKVLREYESHHPKLRVLDQTNTGQGVARNRALDLARGEYVLFVDSDDFIERVTLQVTTERAEQDQSDVVHFDWKTTSLQPERPATFNYFNIEPYWHLPVLEGDECSQLLRMGSYFTVNNLYRRSFLNEQNIRYDEYHIYEDVPFMIQVASRAARVSLLHSPLYAVQQNPTSTTKSGVTTDRHYRGHIHAMRLSFELLEPRIKYAKEYLARYHLQKFLVYRQRRVPRKLRRSYTRDFVEILHREQLRLPKGSSLGGRFTFCMRMNVFAKKRVTLLGCMAWLNERLGSRVKGLGARLCNLRNLKRRGLPLGETLQAVRKRPTLESLPSVETRLVVFLGFDGRYIGNSRALFESMRRDVRFQCYRLVFLTDDQAVPAEMRVSPGTTEATSLAEKAEVLIAESWIPERVRKNPGSIWIQLWHGTPFKRILFDSAESKILSVQKRHKINKYRDVLRWDYLVVDSPSAAEKFSTALLFPPERMLPSGYPRVKYLRESRGDKMLKAAVRKELGLEERFALSKVVLYAPTWRDQNYGLREELRDFNYLLDLDSFASSLGEDYVVLFHNHGYMGSPTQRFRSNIIDVSNHDIQDLLLVTDVLVSDYSSVIFDAMTIDLPFVLYTPDLEEFEKVRGVYSDMLSDFAPYRAEVPEVVVSMVKDAGLRSLPEALGMRYRSTAHMDLLDFCASLRLADINRNW